MINIHPKEDRISKEEGYRNPDVLYNNRVSAHLAWAGQANIFALVTPAFVLAQP